MITKANPKQTIPYGTIAASNTPTNNTSLCSKIFCCFQCYAANEIREKDGSSIGRTPPLAKVNALTEEDVINLQILSIGTDKLNVDPKRNTNLTNLREEEYKSVTLGDLNPEDKV